MENDLLDSPAKGVSVRNDELSLLTEAEKEKLYQYTANLLTTGFSNEQIREKLTKLGHSTEIVDQMIQELSVARTEVSRVAKSQRGNPTLDLVLGSLFLVAGLVGTFADTGYIFYGAIIFGLIRLIKGIINLSS